MTPSISREEYADLLDRSAKPKRQVARPRYRREEGALQLEILKYLSSIGSVCGKTKTMGVMRGKVYTYDPYTMVGKCDLEAFYKGVMYGIEVKSSKGKLSPMQESYRDLFHKPPDRVYIEAHCLDDVTSVIK